jgi:hypothetical protein
MFKEEFAVNVERSIGGMRKHGEWASGLKGRDEAPEVSREDRPDESGNRPVTTSKGPLIGKEGIEHLSHS